ncbi:MAG: hypothetical protein WCP69_09440 [Bacteroidota bacterium]
MQNYLSEFKGVISWVLKNEPQLINDLNKEKLDLKKDLEGCWTIKDVLLKYGISSKTFWLYRKNVKLYKEIELKEEGKIGKFKQYKKKNVIEFMKKLKELKSENPYLFKPEYFNRAG